jgi:hypothetical protein
MKRTLLILVLGISSCNSAPIMGNWVITRSYDWSNKTWKAERGVGLSIRKDGTYGTSGSAMRFGKYMLDQNTTPNRIVFSVDNGRQIFGIYKIEDGKLIMKLADKGFPSDFETEQKSFYEDISEFEPAK